MVLENVKEMWTEKPKGSKGKGVNKDRFISKMYVLDVGDCALSHAIHTPSLSLSLSLSLPSNTG